MRGLIIILSLVSLHNCREIGPKLSQKDEKITIVQIKPLSIKENSDRNSPRSSNIENLPSVTHGSPIYSLTINTGSQKRFQRSAEDSHPTDYDDSSHESEDRFDTSEALSPSDSEQVADGDDQQSDEIKSVGVIEENELYKPGSYNANGASKSKFSPKKYYGNSVIVNPVYRKYLETRQFRSRCRCERIWNCPKLQISVPRCPEEYFMCCF